MSSVALDIGDQTYLSKNLLSKEQSTKASYNFYLSYENQQLQKEGAREKIDYLFKPIET